MFIINHLARPYNSDCSVYDDICKWAKILNIVDDESIRKRERAYEIARCRFYITVFIITVIVLCS